MASIRARVKRAINVLLGKEPPPPDYFTIEMETGSGKLAMVALEPEQARMLGELEGLNRYRVVLDGKYTVSLWWHK